MKILTFVLFLLCASSLRAEIEGFLEGRISYYHPTNKTFREIYHHRAFYGVEGSVAVYRQLNVYGAINVLPSSGKSISTNPAVGKSKTFLTFVPMEFGLKYFFEFPIDCVDLYVAAGIMPSYAQVKNDSPFVTQQRDKWFVGGAFKAGFLVYIRESNAFFDLFAGYYHLKMDYSNTSITQGRDADYSGISAGGGVGYRF